MKASLICPLLSTGRNLDMVCIKERCAWYAEQTECCSILLAACSTAAARTHINIPKQGN